jgi:hypothetical protein
MASPKDTGLVFCVQAASKHSKGASMDPPSIPSCWRLSSLPGLQTRMRGFETAMIDYTSKLVLPNIKTFLSNVQNACLTCHLWRQS